MLDSFKNPDDLLKFCGITTPSEISLRGLCDVCDVKVEERILTDCEARIIGGKRGAVVSVQQGIMETRKRFCVGHELGHWMHDRGTPSFECTKSDIGNVNIQNQVEARANRYAADLLMPKKMFLKEARKFGVDFDAVGNLAKLFRTSINATALRLVKVGDLPAAFICTATDGTQKYAIRGADIPTSIRINKNLNSDSYASELMKTGKQYQNSQPVPADYWFFAKNADEFEVYEHSVKGFNGEIWTLLWWKDEEMLEEA